MTISRNHRNRRPYNWLVYDIGDRFLEKNAKRFKGILYDLGAGESPYRDFFLRHADRYVSVDWAGSYHKTNADILADLNLPLPIDDAVADSVVSLSVLEHLCEPQVMLNEAFRILKPGGEIVLQVPWQWWIHEAPYDYFRYTPYGLKYLFQKAGFEDIQVEPQSGFFTARILKWNYFTNRFVRGPRLVRRIIMMLLRPLWFIGQKVAPFLDKLDSNWAAESTGFYAVAIKRKASSSGV